jgi:hypothetical protein
MDFAKEITTTVEITPEDMAQAFWAWSDVRQAEFLVRLAEVIEADHAGGNRSAYSLGELQWFGLGHYLLNDSCQRTEAERDKARSMLMAMAAPLFLHTLLAAGQ